MMDKPHWSVCPICGLAGPVSAPGVSYCRMHGELHDPEPPEEWTPIERILGRRGLGKPPDLHELIRRHGGYLKIPAEFWREDNLG